MNRPVPALTARRLGTAPGESPHLLFPLARRLRAAHRRLPPRNGNPVGPLHLGLLPGPRLRRPIHSVHSRLVRALPVPGIAVQSRLYRFLLLAPAMRTPSHFPAPRHGGSAAPPTLPSPPAAPCAVDTETRHVLALTVPPDMARPRLSRFLRLRPRRLATSPPPSCTVGAATPHLPHLPLSSVRPPPPRKRRPNCFPQTDGRHEMTNKVHKPYCFAGQPAPCKGYFSNDVLPCVCGSNAMLLEALSKVTMPAVPVTDRAPAEVYALPLTA